MTVYGLSTVIIYSTAYRLPIWIAYKISYKHSLCFGIPGVSGTVNHMCLREVKTFFSVHLHSQSFDLAKFMKCIQAPTGTSFIVPICFNAYGKSPTIRFHNRKSIPVAIVTLYRNSIIPHYRIANR